MLQVVLTLLVLIAVSVLGYAAYKHHTILLAKLDRPASMCPMGRFNSNASSIAEDADDELEDDDEEEDEEEDACCVPPQ